MNPRKHYLVQKCGISRGILVKGIGKSVCFKRKFLCSHFFSVISSESTILHIIQMNAAENKLLSIAAASLKKVMKNVLNPFLVRVVVTPNFSADHVSQCTIRGINLQAQVNDTSTAEARERQSLVECSRVVFPLTMFNEMIPNLPIKCSVSFNEVQHSSSIWIDCRIKKTLIRSRRRRKRELCDTGGRNIRAIVQKYCHRSVGETVYNTTIKLNDLRSGRSGSIVEQ